jgi:hypothetical protein
MFKLGFAHALLLDLAAGGDRNPRRTPRYSDSLVMTLAPLNSGVLILRLMRHLCLLDEAQLIYLQQAEQRLLD